MSIDRRLRDRNEDAASSRWLWKLVVFAVLVTIASWLFVKYGR